MADILYIGETAGFTGGIERYMARTAELLRSSGHQICFAGSGRTGRFSQQFCACFNRTGNYEDLPELIRQTDLTILHKILPDSLLSLLSPERTFFFAHDHQAYCRRHHYYTPLGRINCHRAFSPLRCLICSLGRNTPPPLPILRRFHTLVLSDFMKQNLVINGFDPARITILPPFVPTEDSPAEPVFMPEGVLRILFLGQLIRGKGCDLMLRSLAALDAPFQAMIAGDGNDRPRLEKLSRRLRLDGKVHFLGWQSRPEELFRQTDLLFFPSRWQEPFGLGGIESLSRGIPVLAFQVGGVGQWLRSGWNGLAVPEKDTAAAAAALKDCCRHPERLAQWGRNGRQMVREQFSPGLFLENFQRLQEVSLP